LAKLKTNTIGKAPFFCLLKFHTKYFTLPWYLCKQGVIEENKSENDSEDELFS